MAALKGRQGAVCGTHIDLVAEICGRGAVSCGWSCRCAAAPVANNLLLLLHGTTGPVYYCLARLVLLPSSCSEPQCPCQLDITFVGSCIVTILVHWLVLIICCPHIWLTHTPLYGSHILSFTFGGGASFAMHHECGFDDGVKDQL